MHAPDPLARNAVTVTGNPEAARTIVFVHGFGTDQNAWKDITPAFVDDFRIVLLDNVGAGRADPQAFVQHRYLNLSQYAHDLLDVCHALKLRDAILVGHSVGAMIGVLATIAEPDCFAKLVLIGASPRYLDDGEYHGGFTTQQLNDLYQAVTLSYAEWAGQFASLAMANEDRPGLAAAFAETIRDIPKDRALTVLCSVFQSDHRADVRRLDKPTLLVHAHGDIAVPESVAGYLQRAITGSRLVMIDAQGHLRTSARRPGLLRRSRTSSAAATPPRRRTTNETCLVQPRAIGSPSPQSTHRPPCRRVWPGTRRNTPPAAPSLGGVRTPAGVFRAPG